MLNIQITLQDLDAGRHYCACCFPPALLVRRAGAGEALASCINSGKLYRADEAGHFILIEDGSGFEGGRRPSLATATRIDLSRESYS